MSAVRSLRLQDVAPAPERAVHYLHAGAVFAAATPTAVTTVLGSCVAVCLWDARLQVGGLNHYLLPFAPGGAPPCARYGDSALPELVTRLTALGATPAHLQAHVVGGAHVLQELEHARHLGSDNVQLALRFLAALNIPVASRETGGTRGRQLLFHTDDGATRVRAF